MESRLDRAHRDAQGRRDLGQRHPKEVMQDDDRTAVGVEVPHRGVHDLPVGEGQSRIEGHRGVDRLELDLDDSPASSPGEIEAGIDGETMEPGVEPIGVTQPRQVAPGSDQCLLDRVAGQLRIPEDEAGGPVQPRDGPADELREGVMIASPRSLDASSLVHGRLGFGTPSWRAR